MKKILKLILIMLILSFVIYPFGIFATAKEPEYENGQLRCSDESKKKNMCEETTKNGKVTKVKLTQKIDDITIIKTVEKIDARNFTVTFEVDGGKKTKIISSTPAYIYIILDLSDSISNKGDVETAVKTFVDDFKDYNNVYFSMSVFADKYKTYIPYTGGSFETSLGGRSQIQFALQDALNEFNSLNIKNEMKKSDKSNIDNAQKYILVFGDGRYWNRMNTCWKIDEWGTLCTTGCDGKTCYNNIGSPAAYDLLGQFSNVVFYGIRYSGTKPNNIVAAKEGGYASCENIKQDECDIKYMKYVAKDYVVDTTKNGMTYKDAFKDIAEKIMDKIKIEEENLAAKITDTVGSSFTNNLTSKKKIDMEFNNEVKKFSFNITIDPVAIDPDAKTDWHKTNKNFEVTYGEEKKFTSIEDLQPEVYWKQESKEFKHCSDSIYTSSKKVEKNDYYNIVCEQGWGDVAGYSAVLKINNLPIDEVNIFTVSNRVGLPVSLELSSNLKCTYEFKKDLFLNDYNSLKKQFNNETNETAKAQFEKKMKKMEDILANYVKESSVEPKKLTTLKDYKEKFEKQEAIFKVSYDKNKYEEIKLENMDDITSTIECSKSSEKEDNVLGNKIYTSRVCTLTSSKSMQLPKYCLSMKGGIPEKCNSSSKKQLDGGHYYYVTSDKSGYLSVFIKNATFDGNNVKLEGDKKDANNPRCQFNVVSSQAKPILFRQIELSDPFLQIKYKTDQKRTVGKNWLNKKMKYNFTNIIDEKIWNKEFEFEYQYQMSKKNIEAIKKDTSQEGVNSYLGRDCQFDKNDHQYKCSFVRSDASNNGSSKLFTNIIVN